MDARQHDETNGAGALSQDDDDYVINVTLHPQDSGVLRQVFIGMGKPTVVVQGVLRDDDVEFDVEGSGDQLDVAALLYTVALAMDPTLGEPDATDQQSGDRT